MSPIKLNNSKYTKPPFCKGCPINHLTEGYIPPFNCETTEQLIVGEAAETNDLAKGEPFAGGAGIWLKNILKRAKISYNTFGVVNTIGCRPTNNIYPGSSEWKLDKFAGFEAVKYCRKHHLQPVLESKPWRKIIALGEQALRSLTFQRGIMAWRNSPLALREDGPAGKPRVLPILHPTYIMKDSKWYDITIGDIKNDLQLVPEDFNLNGTLLDLQAWDEKEFAFDLEWNPQTLEVSLCGFSNGYGKATVWDWKPEYIPEIKRIFEESEVLIGHNIVGADLPILKKLNFGTSAKLMDTMLMQHLIMPDVKHDLGFCASVFTRAIHWKGKGKDEATGGQQWQTWNMMTAIPIKYGGYGGCKNADHAYKLYNARDVSRNYEIYPPIQQLVTQWNLDTLYENVAIPTSKICRRLGDQGIKIDPTKIKTINETLTKEIGELEKDLPKELQTYYKDVNKFVTAEAGTYRPKTKKCKGKKSDNTQHPMAEYIFTQPGSIKCFHCLTLIPSGPMSLVKKIKVPGQEVVIPWRSEKIIKKYATNLGLKKHYNYKTKKETSGKDARKVWGREYQEFVVINELSERSTLRSNFAKEALLKESRLYFNLLPHGTATGRLSSSGKRKKIDGNIQNQPKSIRHIYVPDTSDMCFLEADWSGAENSITAYLAEDWDRLKCINDGVDEHSELASWIFKREVTDTNKNKHLRKVGKFTNHMLNYGGGPKKLQEELFMKANVSYTLSEIKDFIGAWREKNKVTYEWQRRVVQQAQTNSYLRNVFGRIRWFKSERFMNEAMAFLPSSTMADMMLRCMIALHASEFPQEIATLQLNAAADLPDGWRMVTQVHDSLLFTGPTTNWRECAQVVDSVMTQKFPELGDFSLGADFCMSEESWGACKKVNIYD